MEDEFELADALQRLIKTHLRGYIVVDGVISAINKNNTCDVIVSTTTFSSVPLKVLIGSQASVYGVPVLKTACLMGFRDGDINRPQIISVDQVDQLLINCKTVVQFNKGQLGGMVKVIDLVNHINTLEKSLNAVKQIFSSWTPVPNDGGAALKAAIESWATQQITLTERSDLENTKIQQ